jgi:hypothetical protein
MKRFALALSAIVAGVVVSSCAVGVRQPATEITMTSATLNGRVLSTTGGPGSWYIEYGLSSARTERTPTRTVDFVVNEIEAVSEPVIGLTPGTIYHYAVCAEDSENPGDPFCSPDQTFTTRHDPAHRDSAVGSGTTSTWSFDFNAESGPSGENPIGQGSVTYQGSLTVSGEVTCLLVSGNDARIGIRDDGSGDLAGAVLRVVDDQGDAGMGIFDAVPQSGQPDACENDLDDPPFRSETGGSITVIDAPPLSTSKR